VKVPHVGWNALSTRRRSVLLHGIRDATQVYFTHSYAAPITRDAAATTEHGARFASVVEKDLVFGVQFHPEKSAEAGLRVLRSFVGIAKFPNSQISTFPNS
jgi:glutamine amidotransferase